MENQRIALGTADDAIIAHFAKAAFMAEFRLGLAVKQIEADVAEISSRDAKIMALEANIATLTSEPVSDSNVSPWVKDHSIDPEMEAVAVSGWTVDGLNEAAS